MRAVLCTIPRTGTRFFAEIIRPHVDELKVWHCTDDAVERIKKDRPDLLVTTIRDAFDLKDAWQRWGDSPERLPGFFKMWMELFKLKPVVVSFDDNREERLKRLSKVLGVELKTDWKPVG